jgi:acyl-CoA reductase-like NAD-dependent aldehyde dehydrogenase
MAPSKLTTIDFGTFFNVVNGENRSSKTKYHGVDPTTKEKLWEVPAATADDIEDAVAAANKAYASWKKTTWTERTKYLQRFKEVYESYQEEMIELLLKETGKPRMFGTVEVQTGSTWFDHHINMTEPKPERYEEETKIIENKYVPLGVVAAICPWNFPLFLSLAKVLPAVQMGNAIIIKPSPFTP